MKKSEYDFKILPDEAYKDDLSYAEKEQADGMLTTAVFGPETEQAKRDEERRSAAGLCFEWLQALATALVIVVLLLTFVFRLVDVEGESMMDTLHHKGKLFVTSLLYTPQNGDVVIVSHGQEYQTPIVKRVIATAGQTVEIDYAKNQVIVDGVIIEEPYIKEPMLKKDIYTTDNPIQVPEGMVFVMGDNRNNSLDSRSHQVGLIAEDDIIGKAEFILFPFHRFSSIYE